MERVAFANYGNGSVKVVQSNVCLGELVNDADVIFVEAVSIFDGAEGADFVAGFGVSLTEVKPAGNVIGVEFERTVVNGNAFRELL